MTYESEADEGDSASGGAVIYDKQIIMANHVIRHAILYFPDEEHSNTDATQADIAKWYLINGRSGRRPKWGGWFNKQISKLNSDFFAEIDKKFQRVMSSEMREAKHNWLSALRNKDAQKILKIFKSAAAKAKDDYNKAKADRDALMSMRDKREELSYNVSMELEWHEQDAWIVKELTKHRLKKNQAIITAREKRDRYRDVKSRLESVKMRLIGIYSSKSYKDRIAATNEMREFAELYGWSREEIADIDETLKILRNPWSYGATQLSAMRKAIAQTRDLAVEILLGAKSPPNTIKTMKNRKSRGNPETPPLNETGEFANSLLWKVV